VISLEQVQLLESRVAKAIEYLQRKDAENASLLQEKSSLQSKLDANQKRLDELEMLVMRFKDDQSKIEDGIMAALDRLSQFEAAFESGLSHGSGQSSSQQKEGVKKNAPKKEKLSEVDLNSEEFFEINEAEDNSGELDIF